MTLNFQQSGRENGCDQSYSINRKAVAEGVICCAGAFYLVPTHAGGVKGDHQLISGVCEIMEHLPWKRPLMSSHPAFDRQAEQAGLEG